MNKEEIKAYIKIYEHLEKVLRENGYWEPNIAESIEK